MASIEQQNISDAITENYNVIVNAVAGSGKTLTALTIASNNPTKNILLLTYSKNLKDDTKKRAYKQDINNLQCHTFHSFCFNKYSCPGMTDDIIIESLSKFDESLNKNPSFDYNIIIIDEAQDLKPLYYNLINLIISHCVNQESLRLCVMGDVKQTINKYNGADNRFLLFSDKLFPVKGSWKTLPLSTSYRFSRAMVNFLNKCVLKSDTMQPNPCKEKPSIKPRYIFCDAFSESPVKELTSHYLVKFDYTYNDIFIIAPSLHSELSPVKTFANILAIKYNLPIFMPSNDTDKIDSKLSQNKIVFATFHQLKGLERKCGIVFGFDNSYFHYYNTDCDKTVCPDEIYTGLTRISERITLIHHYKKNFLDFLDVDLISKYCYTEKIIAVNLNIDYFQKLGIDLTLRMFDDIETSSGFKTKPIIQIMHKNNINNSLNKDVKLSVTKLISHLSSEHINGALRYLKITEIKNDYKPKIATEEIETSKVNIIPIADTKTETIKDDKFTVSLIVKDLIRANNVSDIIGTAIPIYYEYKNFGKTCIMTYISNELKNKPCHSNIIYKNIYDRFNRIKKLENLRAKDLFELVTIFMVIHNGNYHKLSEITNYNFMTLTDLNRCNKRIKNHIGNNPRFEVYKETLVTMEIEGYDVPVKRIINGYIDCIDDDTVWEFKTVQRIEKHMILQLALYAFLFYCNMETGKTFKILNINDGTKYLIEASVNNFKKMFDYVFFCKFHKPKPLSNSEFIKLYKQK